MKKRILATLLSITVILVTVCAHVGAATFNGSVYSVDYANSNVKISTTVGIPNINTSLIVLNDTLTLEDVQESIDDGTGDANAFQYQTLLKTDANGKIEYIFPLNIANKEVGGSFEVHAKIPRSKAEKLFTIDYMSKEERFDFINEFQTGVDTIKAFLEYDPINDDDQTNDDDLTNRQVLGIRDDLYNALDEYLLATNMLNKFDSYVSGEVTELSTDDFSSACEYARELVVLEAFNRDKSDVLFGYVDDDNNEDTPENYLYLFEDMLDFAKYDTLNNTNVYSTFKNVISNDGKKEIAEKLMGKNYATVDDLYKDFAINTILIGLTNPKEEGFAQVEVLLSAGNRKYVGLTFGKVSEDMEVKISEHSGFSSLTELTNFVSSGSNSSDNSGSGSGTKPTKNEKTFGGGAAAAQPIVPPVETPVVVFKDVPEDHWAVEGIAYLKAKNVINGVSSDSFDPNGFVTREQLVKMIFAITNLKLVEGAESHFTDAPKDAWYTDYIVAMSEGGYINGISETQFGVGQYATRQDICTIVNRILELQGSGLKFSDNDDIAEYASEAVAALAVNSIVNGYPDGSFRPNGNCTRAEVATIIYRASKFAEVK